MLTLGSLLPELRTRPSLEDVLHHFRPPPRFAPKSFDDYGPRHPSQQAAVERLRQLAKRRSAPPPPAILRAILPRRRSTPAGIYLDGGFGVGKTHLLASLWNSVPVPKAYLSFDELMYFIGIAGPAEAAATLSRHRLVAIDEWELDDPGNLKLALAFLREVLSRGVFVAVTSNTLPLELGRGRFSQKDFKAEVEELAAAFEVVRIEGDDYRHRQFEARPGTEFFLDEADLPKLLIASPPATLQVAFDALLEALSSLHPIRFRYLARRVAWMIVTDVRPIADLAHGLRWVHFIDAAYDARLRFAATGEVPLRDLFPHEAMNGPYGKKLSRCLSRMEEMLSEDATATSNRRGSDSIEGDGLP